MTYVVVNDASCLIDLRKGGLLPVLCCLPYSFIVPFPIRHSELLDFMPQEWAQLDDGGMSTYDLPPEQMEAAFALRHRQSGLSANDCICMITAQCHEEGILLTGDRLLRSAAEKLGCVFTECSGSLTNSRRQMGVTMRCWSPPWKLGRRIDRCFFRKTLLTSGFSVFAGRIVQGVGLAWVD